VHLAADPYFGDNVVARYRNLWEPLVTEGVADAGRRGGGKGGRDRSSATEPPRMLVT
jgi:hypothetical protein